MEVILIRHTSVDVPKGTCYGQSDVPVATTFAEEAEVTRQKLEQYQPFDAVYASPLTRARLLAAYCGYPRPRLEPANWQPIAAIQILRPTSGCWR